jgi:parvulin-like peptidyl-prolyl isomerase
VKKIVQVVSSFFLTALIFFALSHPAKLYALDDAIIAVVNDELITLKDLRDYIHSTYVSLVAQGVSDEEIRSMMQELQNDGLNKLIEDKLILSKANQLGLTVKDKLIDQRMDEIKSKYPSDEKFMEALISNGSTLTDLRKKVMDQYKIQYVVEHEVRSKIFVNPQEVTEYYNKHIEEYKKKESIDLESIFIPFGNDKTEAYKKAYEAQNLLKEGGNFDEISKKYSSTPSLGKVERGQLLKKIEDIVFDMEIGQVSDTVEVDNGIYIFKIVDQFPAEIYSLEEVKDEIYDALMKSKFKNEVGAWIARLKKNAYIEIKK